MPEINQLVNLVQGDTSGLAILRDFQKLESGVESSLKNLKSSGALNAFDAGSSSLAKANTQATILIQKSREIEQALDQVLRQLLAEEATIGEISDSTAISLSDVLGDYESLQGQLEAVQVELAQYSDAAIEAAKAAEEASDEETDHVIDNLEKVDKARQKNRAYAEIGRGIQDITQPLSEAINIPAIQGLGRLANDVTQLGTTLPELQQGILKAGSGIKSGIEVFKVGAEEAGPGLAGLGGGIEALTASLGPLLPLLALAALAAAPWLLILKANSDAYAEGTESAKAYGDALDREISLKRQLAGFAESGDYTGAKKFVATTENAWEDANAKIDGLEKRKAELLDEYNARQFNAFQKAFDPEENRLVGAIDQINKDIADSYVNTLGPAIDQMKGAQEALPDIQKASEAKQAVDNQVAALQRSVDIQLEISDLIKNGSSAQLQARKDQIQQEIAAIEAIHPNLVAMSSTSETAAAALKQYDDRLASLHQENDALTGSVIEATAAREAEAKAISDQLSAIDKQIQLQQQYSNLIESGSTEQVNSRLKDLESEKQAISKMLPEVDALAATSKEAADKAAELRARLEEINNESSTLSNSVLPAVKIRERKEGLDELEKAESDSNDKIAEIRQANLKKLQDIESKAGDALVKEGQAYTDSLNKNEQKRLDSISNVDTDYMRSSSSAWRKFYEEERQATTDAANERLKILQEGMQSMNDAEEQNNVVAYLKAEADTKSKLEAQSKTASEEEQQRQTQFSSEREESRLEHDQRIADINDQAEKERLTLEQAHETKLSQIQLEKDKEIEQLKVQQQQQIDAEQAALSKKMLTISKNYGIEEDLITSISEKRQEALKKGEKDLTDSYDRVNAVKEKADQENIQKQVSSASELAHSKIQFDQQTMAAFASTAKSTFDSLLAYLHNQAQSVQQSSQSQLTSAPHPSLGAGFGFTGTAFANEGIIDVASGPKLALYGESLLPGEKEAFIRFNPSQGIDPAKLGVSPASYSFPIGSLSLAAGITPEQFEATLMQFAEHIVQGIKEAQLT